MLLLVGLGNSGPEYMYQRHNIGFMVVDAIVQKQRFSVWNYQFQGLIAKGCLSNRKTLVLKPQTFMNNSGLAVGAVVRFFKLVPEQVVVIHDELDLAPGKCRVKLGGSNAGHNGLRSIDKHIGTGYWRVRIGIGRPKNKALVLEYVLHDFTEADQIWLNPLISAVAEAIPLLGSGYPDRFATRVALV
jgi:PTH1 family peptidyl-tRNA hydrolase